MDAIQFKGAEIARSAHGWMWMSVLASDKISEQMKRRLVRRAREARDSFDTKSEFPAIAPPMKPNSILRLLLLPPLSP